MMGEEIFGVLVPDFSVNYPMHPQIVFPFLEKVFQFVFFLKPFCVRLIDAVFRYAEKLARSENRK